MTDDESHAYIAAQLREHPGMWALVAEGGELPVSELVFMPSEELRVAARRVWEAQGPWAPLGAFDVQIRNNNLYIMFRPERKLDEPLQRYTRGGCFFCGRAATHLAMGFGSLTCRTCIPVLEEAAFADGFGAPQFWEFEIDPDRDRIDS